MTEKYSGLFLLILKIFKPSTRCQHGYIKIQVIYVGYYVGFPLKNCSASGQPESSSNMMKEKEGYVE